MRDLYKAPEAPENVSDNDFDIVEHFSDDEGAKNATMSQFPKNRSTKTSYLSFPKALHRGQMGHGLGRGDHPKTSETLQNRPAMKKLISQGGDDDIRTGPSMNISADNMLSDGMIDIANMTDEEIRTEQQFLYDKLGKEMCEFLIQRRLKKLGEKDQAARATDVPKVMAPTPANNAPQTEGNSKASHSLSKYVTFSADTNELRKIEWTNPVESTSRSEDAQAGDLWLHQLRFDFDGNLMDALKSCNGNKHKHEGSLYNHGAEPDMPGYTFPELLELMQSSFKPQVQIATRTICNIVHMAHVASKRYFGYSCERWYTYVLHDIDLIGKMGYIVMQSTSMLQVVVDALRCMSILLYGDIVPADHGKEGSLPSSDLCGLKGVLIPLQEMLSELCQRDLGLGIYSWNPLTTTFSEGRRSKRRPKMAEDSADESVSATTPEKTKYSKTANADDIGGAKISREGKIHKVRFEDFSEDECIDGGVSSMNTVEEKVAAFYRDAVNGEHARLDVDQIKKRLADALEIEETDEYRLQDMDSTLHLITQFDFINRLCCILNQNRANVILHVYSITVLCGLIMRFGSPLAGALLDAPYFIQCLEELTASLLVGTEQHNRLSEALVNCTSEGDQQELTSYLAIAIMSCMRFLSIFSKDAFTKALDKIGAIALVKQTLTTTYAGHLSRLFNASTRGKSAFNLIGLNMVMSSTVAIKCLNIWAVQDVNKDTLDEMVPIIDVEMFKLCDLAEQGDESLKAFISANGMLIAQVFTHIATLLENSDMSSHVKFIWSNGRFDDMVLAFCRLPEALAHHDLGRLMAAIFHVQSAYMKYMTATYDKDKRSPLAEKQCEVFRAMANYVSVVSKRFCRENKDTNIRDIVFQWYCGQIRAGNVHPVAYACGSVNGISQLVEPVQIANWMLEILDSIGTAGTTLYEEIKATLKSDIIMLKDSIVALLRSLHKIRLDGRPVSGYEKGSTAAKPMPMLESWASFIVSFNQLYVGRAALGSCESGATATSIFAALTVSCYYPTIYMLVKQLCCFHGVDGKSTSVDVTFEAFKDFNIMISREHTLGNANLAIINFVAFVARMVINGITRGSDSSQAAQNVLLELLVRNESIKTEFLRWLPDFDVANNLIRTVMNEDDDITWIPDRIFIEALEVIVFRGLSMKLNIVMPEAVGDANAGATETKLSWNELVEHMAKVEVSARDDGILMSAAAISNNTTDDELSKATIGIINKFNSGIGDSPFVMAILMLLISVYSRVDCAKKIWADTSLMVLLGRNLVLDTSTKEITCITPSGNLVLGSIYMYLPTFNASREILRSHQKLLSEFNEEDLRSGNAIMAIVMSSLARCGKQ